MYIYNSHNFWKYLWFTIVFISFFLLQFITLLSNSLPVLLYYLQYLFYCILNYSFYSIVFYSILFVTGFDLPFSGIHSDLLCTIFSASNYGGGGNSGAYMVFSNDPNLNNFSVDDEGFQSKYWSDAYVIHNYLLVQVFFLTIFYIYYHVIIYKSHRTHDQNLSP